MPPSGLELNRSIKTNGSSIGSRYHLLGLSESSGTITNIVFGFLAAVIGIATLWQAQRAYLLWRDRTPLTHNRGKHNIRFRVMRLMNGRSN